MKNILYILILLLAFPAISWCQCPTGDVIINNQSQIDNFIINYPNCTTISGKLSLQGSSIINLNGFANITTVTGNVEIFLCNNLPNLNGFNNLTTIGGLLSISATQGLTNIAALSNLNSLQSLSIGSFTDNLANLNGLQGITTLPGFIILRSTSFTGLNNLVSVGGNATFEGNSITQNFNGLNALSTVGGDLIISGSSPNITALNNLTQVAGNFDLSNLWNLTNVGGLNNLLSVGGYLRFENNPKLTNLNGLNGLTSIGSHLLILDNWLMTSINGLNALLSVGGRIEIFENFKLTTLNAFNSLQTISGNIEINYNILLNNLNGPTNLINFTGSEIFIFNNNVLQSIQGIGNMTIPTGTSVSIIDNPQLSICAVTSICNFLNSGGIPGIAGNATGCSTLAQVQAACTALPLELLSFTAKPLQNTNEIRWITSTERNISHHLLEWSSDGLANWQEINRQSGAFQSNTERPYSYEDSKPQPVSYYRLRSVDMEGSEQLSPIVQVVRLGKQLTIHSAYPLPVEYDLNMSFYSPEEGEVTLELIDILGKVVMRQPVECVTGVNRQVLNLSGLPVGVYSLVAREQRSAMMGIKVIKK